MATKKKEDKKYGIIYKCQAVNIRQKATLRSAVVTEVEAGEEVEILGEKGDFFNIKYHGHKGYTLKLFIAVE